MLRLKRKKDFSHALRNLLRKLRLLRTRAGNLRKIRRNNYFSPAFINGRAILMLTSPYTNCDNQIRTKHTAKWGVQKDPAFLQDPLSQFYFPSPI
ncbi:DUF6783 domain-containing protein [Blautia glucerasea]|uniref:DUF6783 domain-containing protein n=1 Tax=Blautia glucerasea TaxID=536633 RepID=UPI003A7F5FA5